MRLEKYLLSVFALTLLLTAQSVIAYGSINEKHCLRFDNEAQEIKRKLNGKTRDTSALNRLQRLEERLRVFCSDYGYGQLQTDTQIKEVVNKPILQVAAAELKPAQVSYQNDAKQKAWLNFYQPSARCMKAHKSVQDRVFCDGEQSQKKEAFEQQWQPEEVEQISTVKTDSVKTQSAPAMSAAQPTQSRAIEAKFNDTTLNQQQSALTPLWVYIGHYVWFILLVGGVIVVLITFWPFIMAVYKRVFGSFVLHRYLTQALSNSRYFIAGKMWFDTTQGRLSVDNLIISKYGVFVIQRQRESGTIWVDQHSDTWTHRVDNERYYFGNPIESLQAKVDLVKELLDLQSHIYGLIVFPEDSVFKTNVPYEVCEYHLLPKRIMRESTTCFDNVQLSEIKALVAQYQSDTSFWQKFKFTTAQRT